MVIVTLLLIAVIFVSFLVMLHLLDRVSWLEIDNAQLRTLCQGKEKEISTLEKSAGRKETIHPGGTSMDRLSTHDTILEMHAAGASSEAISQALEIPEKKVEMTLRIESMKTDGTR